MSKQFKSLVCLLLLTLGALSLNAQPGKRLTVQIQNGTVLDCIKSIEEQTDYSFLFSNSIGVEKKVSVNCVNQTLDQVLAAIFSENGIAFDIVGNQITLRKTVQGRNQPNGLREITGRITDSKGDSVIGAGVVLVEDPTKGTITSTDGSWSLNVPNGQITLQVSSLGYTTRQVTILPGQNIVNISLDDDALNLDEIVVVGYSTTTKRELISSVSTVKTQQISNLPVVNVSQGLAGRSPGLIVTQSGGGINTNPTISVRGGGDPIYVIDGVIRPQGDFVRLSPEDIEQMNILKDASATAVYGARAANGIIQIVTRKGTQGKASVEYDFNHSMAQPAFWPKTLRLYERYEYANQGYLNEGQDLQYTNEIISKAKQGLDAEGRKMDVVRDVTMRSWAPLTKHTVRLYGGNDIASTYVSFSNTDQQSLFKNADYALYRSTIHLAQNVNLRKFGVQISAVLDGTTQSQHSPRGTRTGGGIGELIGIIQNAPERVLFNNYDLPWSTGTYNMYSELSKDVGYDRYNTNVINAKGELIWSVPWIKGLKTRISSDYRYAFVDDKVWIKPPAEYLWDSTKPIYVGQASLSLNFQKAGAFTNQVFVEYTNTFGKHSLSAVAGYEQYYEKTINYTLGRREYEFLIDQISVGPADTQTNSGSEGELGRASWIGQARYNYGGKYYFEGAIRHDGSDYFAPGKRWGTFFGGSVGWVLSSEPWMRAMVDNDVLNLLKLRASYGQTGLDSSAGRFAYMQSYTLNALSYVVDGVFVPGFTEGSLPSPDLSWYTTTQTDIGFDFSSAKNRLYGMFDYFFYKTHGYLVSPTGESYLNKVIGIGMPKVKSDSEYRREGVEIHLGWRDVVGDFSYDISANATYFDQLWAYDQSEAESSYMNPYTRTQQNRGYYGNLYHALGYYADQSDVFNSVAILGSMNSGNLFPGDIKYEDSNGDGQITSEDYRHLGKASVPRCQFGINIALGYKGFFFNSLIQGSSKSNKMISGTNLMKTDQVSDLLTIYPYQKDTWTPANTDAAYPRLTWNSTLNNNNNYVSSDFWLLDCSYVRLKDIQLGYDFKYSALRKFDWLSKLKVGISGQNLFTISKAQKYGLDPENGSAAGYAYPVERTIALTVNIGF